MQIYNKNPTLQIFYKFFSQNFRIMDKKDRIDVLTAAYNRCISSGKVKSKAEFADFVGVNRSTMSSAFGGDDRYLTDKLVAKVIAAVRVGEAAGPEVAPDTLPVLPIGARAGTIQDWSDAVHDYDCERIVSPIRGAEFAAQVTGDSMSPEYPSGSQVIVKRINEDAFVQWGEVYLLDTVNGPVLKQVRKTDRDGVVECVSINPAYQPFRVDCKDIRGWYRVLLCMALK